MPLFPSLQVINSLAFMHNSRLQSLVKLPFPLSLRPPKSTRCEAFPVVDQVATTERVTMKALLALLCLCWAAASVASARQSVSLEGKIVLPGGLAVRAALGAGVS